MRKLFYFFSIFFISIFNAQVGINTTDPQATLDINGNLIIRTVNPLSALTNNHTVLIRDKSTSGDNEIKEINPDVLFNGISSSVYSATKSGSFSLLELSIGGNWYKINLTGISDTKLGNPALFTSGIYTAPQSGIYAVHYEFQLESGANLEVLGGKKLGIIKNSTIWEEKKFDGVRVSITIPPLGPTITVASVPVTSSAIQSLVSLNAGDSLTFAVNTNGVLPINLGVLTDSKVSLYIYKVSN